jgi:hypothetical protein
VDRGLHREDIRIIHNGVDLRFFAPDPRLARFPTPTFLYVGRLKRYERIGLAIDAVALLRDRGAGVRLLVAGAGTRSRGCGRRWSGAVWPARREMVGRPPPRPSPTNRVGREVPTHLAEARSKFPSPLCSSGGRGRERGGAVGRSSMPFVELCRRCVLNLAEARSKFSSPPCRSLPFGGERPGEGGAVGRSSMPFVEPRTPRRALRARRSAPPVVSPRWNGYPIARTTDKRAQRQSPGEDD